MGYSKKQTKEKGEEKAKKEKKEKKEDIEFRVLSFWVLPLSKTFWSFWESERSRRMLERVRREH